jgi:hypothetical protein
VVGFSTMTLLSSQGASVMQLVATLSPDLAPKDLWLFPKIQSVLKGEDFRILKTYKKKMK